MRADRLLAILSLLQTHGRQSSRELAVQLEVSERTIHRDMEALSIAGIPVYAERGAKGGWTLTEGYRNQLTGMNIGEIRTLLFLHSSSVIRDLGLQEQVKSAFHKLLTALPPNVQRDAEYARERIHIDGAGWHQTSLSKVDVSLLPIVQQAVWEQVKLQITYRGWDSDADKTAVVSPLGLVAKMSIWYMVALKENEIRTYRISRLKEASRTEDAFARPGDFNLALYWEQSTTAFQRNLPRYPAHIRVASTHWNKLMQERYVTVQSNSSNEESNWVEAHVDFQTLDIAIEIILSYGRHVRALTPDELRHAVYAESRAVALSYEHDEAY